MTIVPIYTSRGDAEAFLQYPYLFNAVGEWVGFVDAKRQVYSVLGVYVGYISNEPRILRKRSTSTLRPKAEVPPSPGRFAPPASVPLAPMMPELTHSIIDVLLEEPERLHTADYGELRQDLE